MKIRLDGKRVVVTGANSGIGQAIALQLAAAGARVCVNYVAHPETAEQVVARIRDGGGDALALEADVSDASQVAQMFSALDRAWGGVDILVNNAAIDGSRAAAWEYPLDAWREVLAINLEGAYVCAREALQRMIRQRGGVVLNVTSAHEFIPWAGYTSYTTSKAGLSMLTKTLAQEAAPYGVRVVAIAPGAIQTGASLLDATLKGQEASHAPHRRALGRLRNWKLVLLALFGCGVRAAPRGNPATRADLMSKIPMGRKGQPDDVAKLAVVLVSDVASYVTGTTVLVDGGMTLYPSFLNGW